MADDDFVASRLRSAAQEAGRRALPVDLRVIEERGRRRRRRRHAVFAATGAFCGAGAVALALWAGAPRYEPPAAPHGVSSSSPRVPTPTVTTTDGGPPADPTRLASPPPTPGPSDPAPPSPPPSRSPRPSPDATVTLPPV
ncbi:hypothetical protein NX801_21980 [Streptomyces sp. LP05-1]|uniref:Cellulase n=1 Tax=Streptomyces pyxinae TaxID=2970734 RepID=A0ABT2CLJ6_9ACTN|nr:hypothetical protein [Streptomyces sp. LP05-1]MCS0638272.1 hypothetical protein [Streptomyces sp. LP05-1]